MSHRVLLYLVNLILPGAKKSEASNLNRYWETETKVQNMKKKTNELGEEYEVNP